jgi:transposase InsO family protein
MVSTMEKCKKKSKKENRKLVCDSYFNAKRSTEELAREFKISRRTVQRWLLQMKKGDLSVCHSIKAKKEHKKCFKKETFERIIQLKKENPSRSAPMLYRLLEKAFIKPCPSISTIRKLLAQSGLSKRESSNRKGYLKFTRAQPNDLWQIDLAGIQTMDHIGKVFLIALLDDCSRYIVAAKYFSDEKGANIIYLLKEAFTNQGRPNQILSDNGAQFRALMQPVETKYTHLLKTLGVEPIFAKPNHPQTKGKLERWFGVVRQMWLGEERLLVKNHPTYTLTEINRDFDLWLHFYNYEKPHRSLNGKTPVEVYFQTTPRISRPLETQVNWEIWLNTTTDRKVTKFNTIKYAAKEFAVPPGYSQLKVDLVDTGTTLEIYYKDKFLISHPFIPQLVAKNMQSIQRRISMMGQISWKGQKYSIDYKYKGKTVEIYPDASGKSIMVYSNGILIKEILISKEQS